MNIACNPEYWMYIQLPPVLLVSNLWIFQTWTTNCTYCTQTGIMLNCLELIVLCQHLRNNNFINMDCNICAQRFSQAEWKSCENEEFASTVCFQELACILLSQF